MSKQSGFTLVEVLVSLVIFSVAIVGLMQSGTANLRAIQSIEQKHIADIVADNQLVLTKVEQETLSPGIRKGVSTMDGRDWQWEIKTDTTEQPGLFRLDVTVREGDGEQVILSRTAFATQANRK